VVTLEPRPPDRAWRAVTRHQQRQEGSAGAQADGAGPTGPAVAANPLAALKAIAEKREQDPQEVLLTALGEHEQNLRVLAAVLYQIGVYLTETFSDAAALVGDDVQHAD